MTATSQPEYLNGNNDQPTTCPKCGARTFFTDVGFGRQRHTCMGTGCGHVFDLFVVAFENTWEYIHLTRWAKNYLPPDEQEAAIAAITKLWNDGDEQERDRWSMMAWDQVLREAQEA